MNIALHASDYISKTYWDSLNKRGEKLKIEHQGIYELYNDECIEKYRD